MSNQTEASPTATAEETPDRKHILLVFVGLILAMLLAALDQMIFSTALPTVVGELGGVEHMLWVTTAYILAATIMMPVYGKLGDLFGRKHLFIFAISIFMIGSIVGGLAQNMPELIAGRAIQGLGGGGLMILAQAIIADVVPARERGKYMGVMGGVFALASVAGPLLGGYFTESLDWRWCFWINIPLGIAAIVSAMMFLHLPKRDQGKPKIDVAGMITLAVASSAIVLATSLGGNTYAWSSWQIIGLFATGVVVGIVFVFIEKRAAEPVMPLYLFKNRNFNLTTGAGLITGIAMFGAMAYMPTYMQMVTGVTATQAGLLMIPMMAAMLITSISSGQYVTKTGTYKFLPIMGSVFIALGLFLLSTMTPDMALWIRCAYLAVMGLGLGLTMQILVLIVQNSFPAKAVGTATAANNYFRQIGASVGSAAVGSLFTSHLINLLGERLPAGVGTEADLNSLVPSAVQDMPAEIQDAIVSSYNDALTPVFLLMVPLLAVSFILLLFVKQEKLATTIERDVVPESFEIDGGSSAYLDTRELETVGARVVDESIDSSAAPGTGSTR
ncbi:MDR family MFS transporter [Demequina oxidasica]|uniref:MDR family MFS transporter n=1 Tax=Demequina oxidasica TaxID=676199 RepID=UPI000A036EB2|nr:MDR family MFS transporter [Demequina oxidasica]